MSIIISNEIDDSSIIISNEINDDCTIISKDLIANTVGAVTKPELDALNVAFTNEANVFTETQIVTFTEVFQSGVFLQGNKVATFGATNTGAAIIIKDQDGNQLGGFSMNVDDARISPLSASDIGASTGVMFSQLFLSSFANVLGVKSSEDDATKVFATDGSVVDLPAGGGGGAFTTTSNVTSNSPGDITTDDFVFGSTSLDDIGSTGDNRMQFDKSNGAFRAGRALGTEWDEVNRGNFSIAMGDRAKAAGENAIALGDLTIASNTGSIAMGDSAEASGSRGIAIGEDTLASGSNSVAIGRNTQATASFAVALGQNNVASGQRSFAGGNFSNAESYTSAVFGRYNLGGGNGANWIATDAVFEVGIGADSGNKANAITVHKDGGVVANELTIAMIDSYGTKSLITKEYFESGGFATNKWILFGDSTTKSGTPNYQEVTEGILNLTGSENHASSGDTISEQVTVLDTLLAGDSAYFTTFTLCTLLIGINDFNDDITLGTRTDAVGSSTTAGQIKDFIEKVLTSNPAIKLYIMTPWEKVDASYKVDNSASIPWSIQDLRILQHSIAFDYGIQVIDLYSLSSINLITASTYTDGVVHLTQTGENNIGYIIAQGFKSNNNRPQEY